MAQQNKIKRLMHQKKQDAHRPTPKQEAVDRGHVLYLKSTNYGHLAFPIVSAKRPTPADYVKTLRRAKRWVKALPSDAFEGSNRMELTNYIGETLVFSGIAAGIRLEMHDGYVKPRLLVVNVDMTDPVNHITRMGITTHLWVDLAALKLHGLAPLSLGEYIRFSAKVVTYKSRSGQKVGIEEGVGAGYGVLVHNAKTGEIHLEQDLVRDNAFLVKYKQSKLEPGMAQLMFGRDLYFARYMYKGQDYEVPLDKHKAFVSFINERVDEYEAMLKVGEIAEENIYAAYGHIFNFDVIKPYLVPSHDLEAERKKAIMAFHIPDDEADKVILKQLK